MMTKSLLFLFLSLFAYFTECFCSSTAGEEPSLQAKALLMQGFPFEGEEKKPPTFLARAETGLQLYIKLEKA